MEGRFVGSKDTARVQSAFHCQKARTAWTIGTQAVMPAV
jgi:hypothetical protein